jgi:hypothetical protein
VSPVTEYGKPIPTDVPNPLVPDDENVPLPAKDVIIPCKSIFLNR